MTQQKETNYVSDDVYKTLLEYSPIPTIDVVFFNPEKTHILLGKRINNPYKDIFYTFGGRLWKNETFEEAAIRIAKKETGIILELSDLFFGGIDNEISDSSIFEEFNYHSVALYFGCILSSDDTKIQLDEQHSENKWVKVDDSEIHPSMHTRIANSLKAVNNK